VANPRGTKVNETALRLDSFGREGVSRERGASEGVLPQGIARTYAGKDGGRIQLTVLVKGVRLWKNGRCVYDKESTPIH
jgi:hypothetical protein